MEIPEIGQLARRQWLVPSTVSTGSSESSEGKARTAWRIIKTEDMKRGANPLSMSTMNCLRRGLC